MMLMRNLRFWLLTVTLLAPVGPSLLCPLRAFGQEKPNTVASRPQEPKEIAQSEEEMVRLYEAGHYNEAIPLAERICEMREKLYGPNHARVAASIVNLAMLHWKNGNTERAQELLLRALKIEEGLDSADTEEALPTLAMLARIYIDQGDFERAERFGKRWLSLLEKARGSDHADLIMPLSLIASAHFNRKQYDQAEKALLRMLFLQEKALGKDHQELAEPLNLLAMVYRLTANHQQATQALLRALAIDEKALGQDHPELLKRLNNLAVSYQDRGDLNTAERYYLRLRAIEEKAFGPEHPALVRSLNNLAMLYRDKGDARKAETMLQQALDLSEKVQGVDPDIVGAVLNNLALLYQRRGYYPKAELLYQRALKLREKYSGPESAEYAITLDNLGQLYGAMGEYDQAESMHRGALGIFEKVYGPMHPDVAIAFNNLANLYQKKSFYSQAEPLFQRSLEIREKVLGMEHPSVANALMDFAGFHLNRGYYQQAEPLYQRALTILIKVYGPDDESVGAIFSSLARIYLAKGDLPQAVAALSRYNDIRERQTTLVLSTGTEEQKRAWMELLRAETWITISFHTRSAPNEPQAIQMALRTLLQRKGRVLDVTAENIQTLRRWFRREDQSLLDQLAEARAQYATTVFRGQGHMDGALYRTQLEKLKEREQKLEAALSDRSAEYGQSIQPITLESVQKLIPEDAALVELFHYIPFNAQSKTQHEQWGSARYVAYVLRREGAPAWVDLGWAAIIDQGVADFRHALRDPKSVDVKPLARNLDEMVMRPVRALLGKTRRVLISPDGALNLLPFAALVDEQDQYLVTRYSFSYLTSGRDLLRLQMKTQSNQTPLVVANPDFGGKADAMSGRLLQQQKELSKDQSAAHAFSQFYFPPLPHTAEEGEALQALLPNTTLLTKSQATKTALKQISRPTILHIATHGFFLEDLTVAPANARGLQNLSMEPGRLLLQQLAEAGAGMQIENPLLRSGLALAGANEQRQEDNGILTAMEVAGLDLYGTKLVALSACDTGVGEVQNGEGVYGLRRALVLAGAETQVMSLWSVSDKGTRELMVAYYRALLQGQGRSEALRQVQLGMLKGVKRQHPYYWASFIQSGEWANLAGKR